jgi:hypothetical protein
MIQVTDQAPSKAENPPLHARRKCEAPWQSWRVHTRLGLALVLCAMADSAWSQTKCTTGSVEKAKQELLEEENLWLQVENDPSALEDIMAPDFLHVVSVGIITRDEQLGYMRKHPAPHSNEQKHFEDLHVRVYSNVGIVNGIVVAEDGARRKKTLFTDVFACRDGKWQAVSAQELPTAEDHR